MRTWTLVLTSTLAGACVLDSEPVGNENETGGTGSESATEATTSDSVSATVSATGGSTTDTSETDDESESGSETGGVAAGCDMPAPNAFGGYNLDLGDFPVGDESQVDLAIDCTILGFNVTATMTEWSLECLDDGGTPHAVRFDIAVSHDGPDGLAALVELPAELRVVGSQNFGGVVDGSAALELAVASIALVGDGEVYGFVVQGPWIEASVFAPLEITFDRDACGVDPPMDDPDYSQEERDMSVTIAAGDQSMTLFSGQWDVLVVPGAATDRIAVDVLDARAMTCCHSEAWISLVGRTYREYAPD